MGIGERQQRDAPHQVERLPRELGDLEAHEPLDRADIGGETAHELAGSPLGEERGREPHQVLEQILAQPRDHALTGGGEQIGLHEVRERLDGEQSREQHGDAVEHPTVVTHERRVEQVPYDLGKREADGGREREARDRRRQGPAVRSDARPQPAEPAQGREAKRHYSPTNTRPAHTPAPTATCAAWSAPGRASNTIAAATATCAATRVTTYHAPRRLVRDAHTTTYAASA